MISSGFFEISNKCFSIELENKSDIIIEEVLSIPESIMYSWHESEIFEGDWFICPVFMRDVDFPDIKNFLPNTSSILQSLGCVTAAISIIKPNTKIYPHTDEIDNDVLLSSETYRVQLGISIPDNCSLSVLNSQNVFETRSWNVGKTLSFDSSKTHKAENLSKEKRVVLIADFEKEKISEKKIEALKNYYLKLYGFVI